jgi:flavin reductase (DIM6/NTAB) family NADH-FMN oxidoreductase RutF
MARMPTPVTVVTAAGAAGPAGATANAVTSLSLSPPLMLACLDRGSRTLRALEVAGGFAINVLAADQAELARRFSTKDPHPEKWMGVTFTDHEGMPLIEGAVMWIACELRDVLQGGDHVIVTGGVVELISGEGDPLLFHDGVYRGLDAQG